MLELVDLTKSFGEVVTLAGLSPEVRPGCALGFFGSERRGQDDGDAVVFGLVRPDSSEVRVRGRPVGGGSGGSLATCRRRAPSRAGSTPILAALKRILERGGR